MKNKNQIVVRTVKIGFNKDVAVFYKPDWLLFKKMAEAIYGAKVVSTEDGRR